MKIELVREIEGSILDIGGGGEGIMGRLYGSQVTAIDNCQEELDEAPGGYEKMLMDGTALTFEDNRFCNVTFFYTLMYMGKEERRAGYFLSRRTDPHHIRCGENGYAGQGVDRGNVYGSRTLLC